MAVPPIDTAPPGPPPAMPPYPQDTRASFSRSRSQQTLVDPSRSYSSVRPPAQPLLGLNIDHALDIQRSPVSTPTSGTLSTPSSAHGSTTGLTTSAFATMQKVYHAKDDIGFWSSLYSQHFIHTRQEATSPQIPTSLVGGSNSGRTTSSRDSASNDSSSNTDSADSQGVIKVWQVLTKTDSLPSKIQGFDRDSQPFSWHQQQPQQQKPPPQFERLPIKVQTASKGLSTSGQPFSIVFFFTVEAAPTTLWYVESAFTRSSTTHEHLELMGTFQPNNPTDPTSFYIYETHEFTTVQPTHEDTTLDILVQSPTGAIYAEFSYTFVNESKHGSASSVSSIVSHQSRAQSNYNNGGAGVTQRESIEHVPPPLAPRPTKPHSETVHSPLDSFDLIDVESSDALGYFPTASSAQQSLPSQRPQDPQQEHQATVVHEDSMNSPSISAKDDATMSRSTTQTSMPTVAQSPFEDEYGEYEEDVEELTAESYTEEPDAGEHFMQATSEFFSKMGYWLYNSRVGQYIARDDKIRTRTVFPTDDIWVLGVHYEFDTSEPTVSPPEITRSRKTSALQAHAGIGRPPGSKTSSINGAGPGQDTARDGKRPTDRRRSHISSPRSMTDSETFPSSQKSDQGRSRSKERHLEKQREKELAKARKIAKAHEREVEKEQEREQKARAKEHEKLEKLKLKISHPHFQKESKGHESKDNGHFHPESERKSHSIHGYQFDAHPPTIDFGLNGQEHPDSKQSVIRRMRSISILQKVPSTLDLRLTKKQNQEPARIMPERTHQSRSQSISSFSVFSHRSAASSSVSSHSQEVPKTRPTSPPIPSSLKTSMSAHEALSSASAHCGQSKMAQPNLSQKQLPELPSADSSPDIPLYNQQESAQQGKNAVSDTSVAGERPSKRRMTVSVMFSKEPKPESSSSLASLKTLITPNKGQSKTKDSGLVQALSQKVSFGSSKDASKKGVTKNVQHWLERRLSSNNLHQQVFVASTDEPVPQVSKDILSSPPSSPLSPSAYRTFDRQGFEQETDPYGRKQVKSQKRSSLLPPSSTSSPKSVLKASSPLSSTSPSFSESRGRPSSPLGISGLDDIGETETIPSFPRFGDPDSQTDEMVNWSSFLGPSLGSSFDPKLELPSSAPTAGSLSNTLPKIDSSTTRPSASRDPSSFSDLVILPPLPPESPTEAFVLLDQAKNGSSASLERSPEDSIMVQTKADTFAAQNRRLKDQLAAFSSSKEENFSDLRSDWEALWPSKSSVPTTDANRERANEFVHVKEKEITKANDQDEEEKQRRERIRKIGSAYLKVRTPTSDLTGGYLNVVDPNHTVTRQSPDIISPKPQLSIAQRNGGLGEALAMVRTSSPVQSLELMGEGLTTSPPSSREPTLLLQVKTDRESQLSPISPSLSVDKSWKLISPRSVSPRHSLPPLPSSTSPLSRSASGVNSSLDFAGAETVLDRSMSHDSAVTRPKSDELLSIPSLSPTHAASPPPLEKQPESPRKPSPNQVTLLKFMSDYQSRVWFTYRKDMARIEPSFYTSDAGWGCMMRTGQSLLAQAFVQLMLGREWRSDLKQTELNHEKYKTLLSWFADEPERYYSIHNIAKSGLALDKRIGEWFGPSTVAHALRRLSQKHVNCPVTIMVPMDNCLRMSEIVSTASAAHASSGTPPAEWGAFELPPVSGGSNHSGSSGHSQRTKWKPVVLLMPVRYGLEKLTERYIGNLKELFKLPQFLGIAGGRPGRSLYFVACQGSELFYFDPHFVKPRATQEELNQCPASSYHCHSVRTMEIVELDPSMMLGFLISSFMDMVDLSNRLKQNMEKAYPLLTLMVDVPIPVPDPVPVQVQVPLLNPSPLPMLTPISPMVLPISIPGKIQAPAQTPPSSLGRSQASTIRASASSPASVAVPVFEAAPVSTSAPRSRARTPVPSPDLVAVPVFEAAPVAVQALIPSPVQVTASVSETKEPANIPATDAFKADTFSAAPIAVPTFEIMAPTPMASPAPAVPVARSIDEAITAAAASIAIPAPWVMETPTRTTVATTTPTFLDLVGPALVLDSTPTEVSATVLAEESTSDPLVPVVESTFVQEDPPVSDLVEETAAPIASEPMEEPSVDTEEELIFVPMEETTFVRTASVEAPNAFSAEELTPFPVEASAYVPLEQPVFSSAEESTTLLALDSARVSVPEESTHQMEREQEYQEEEARRCQPDEEAQQSEEELEQKDERKFEQGVWLGGIVPGDKTVLVVEARASVKVRHVQAIVDEDDSDFDEEPVEESFSYTAPSVPTTSAEEVVSSSSVAFDEATGDAPHSAPQAEPELTAQPQDSLLEDYRDALLQEHYDASMEENRDSPLQEDKSAPWQDQEESEEENARHDSPLQEHLTTLQQDPENVTDQDQQDSHLQEDQIAPQLSQEEQITPQLEQEQVEDLERQDLPLQEVQTAPLQDQEQQVENICPDSPSQEQVPEEELIQKDSTLLESQAVHQQEQDVEEEDQVHEDSSLQEQQSVPQLEQAQEDDPVHETLSLQELQVTTQLEQDHSEEQEQQDSPLPEQQVASRQEEMQEEVQVHASSPLEYQIAPQCEHDQEEEEAQLESPVQEQQTVYQQQHEQVQKENPGYEEADLSPEVTMDSAIESPAPATSTATIVPASPPTSERPRSKKAMKRITKALKKERKSAKKEEQVKQQQLQRQHQQQQQQLLLHQQQQQQQEQEQHHQAHHHHSLFHRKNHRQQSQQDKEQLQYDPYQYKYTTHEGDHVHDQETLSVKSLDSEDDLDF